MPRYRATTQGLVSVHGARPHPVDLQRVRSSAAWQRIAKRQIRRHPECAECGHEGSKENPLTCDHVIPIEAGGAVWDRMNHQTLCRSCNASKSAPDHVGQTR